MQALMMRSEWFAVGRKGAEGPREEHFLWLLGRPNAVKTEKIRHDGRKNFIYDYLLTTVMPLSLVDNFDFPIQGGIRSYFVTSWSVPF